MAPGGFVAPKEKRQIDGPHKPGCSAVFNTDMRRLTTGIRSEKRVVKRFRRCANITQCTYTNPDSTV